jgi:PhzF family phenazine biosynthesis protein
MVLPAFVVDAFTQKVFQGNPAAVVPLETWLPDSLMQSIAAEHNLAETVFYVPFADEFEIRWFTPTLEIDLCGHATVAAAFIINQFAPASRIVFQSKSGPLPVEISPDGKFTLDFPSRPPEPVEADPHLLAGLNVAPAQILASRDYLVRYETEQEVRDLKPSMNDLAASPRFVIATAPGNQSGVDFVSRFFAPRAGVPEDPVTGSAHSTLIELSRVAAGAPAARQASQRSG